MKVITIEKDIHLISERAVFFPDGVPETFKSLENKLDKLDQRKCFGVYKEKGDVINYRAAFSQLESDSLADNADTFIVEKGSYLSIEISDFYKKIETIGPTFCKLFEDERIDTSSASIEMYEGNTLICMVKMKA